MSKTPRQLASLPYTDRLVDVERRPPPKGKADPKRSAYERECVELAARGERQTFASWTLSHPDGLAIFNRSPSRSWWVRTYDLEPILAAWGLDALEGIVACGAGAPAQTVPIAAHIDSPRVAPMMAEAFGRLAKQRAIAEKWLFDFPEAAAVGLVPAAAGGAKKEREFARGALARLIEGGRSEIVRDVVERYDCAAGLDDLWKHEKGAARKPAASAAKSEKEAAPDPAQRVHQLEDRLRRATPSQETYDLLDELAHLDSDRALFALAELTAKARSGPLRRRAEQALAAARSRRGLSEEDLAVRMIPTAGLDDPEVRAGRLTYRLAVSPALEAEIIGPAGVRSKMLPDRAPAELTRRFALLRKELKRLAASTRARFERRMISGEAWTMEAFRAHVVAHPLLAPLVSGLLLRAVPGEVLFRVAEGGTFMDEADATISLPHDAQVTIVHPLDLDEKTLARWSGRFDDHGLTQPFPQLAREVFQVVAKAGKIPALAGTTISCEKILGLERRGWERGHIDHGPTLESMRLGLPDLVAEVWFKPGLALESPLTSGAQRIVSVTVSGDQARELSEVMRDLS